MPRRWRGFLLMGERYSSIYSPSTRFRAAAVNRHRGKRIRLFYTLQKQKKPLDPDQTMWVDGILSAFSIATLIACFFMMIAFIFWLHHQISE